MWCNIFPAECENSWWYHGECSQLASTSPNPNKKQR